MPFLLTQATKKLNYYDENLYFIYFVINKILSVLPKLMSAQSYIDISFLCHDFFIPHFQLNFSDKIEIKNRNYKSSLLEFRGVQELSILFQSKIR